LAVSLEQDEGAGLLARDDGGHWYRSSDRRLTAASTGRDNGLRIGVVAQKNTPRETRWLADLLGYTAEPYRPGRRYDVVCFFNVTEELRFLRAHTDARLVVVALEPKTALPLNYDPALLDLCDLYLGYGNFASPRFTGEFRHLRFPATTYPEIGAILEDSLQAVRPVDFCIFANHDPHHRRAIGHALARRNAILAGPLFGNRVDNKLDIQRHCKYEFITESDINEYYFSEKLPQALLGGCIPVYYGCTTVEQLVPAGLFVSLREQDLRGDGLEKILDHLQRPDVVARFHAQLREGALPFLRESCTFETNIVAPLEDYFGRLATAGFRSVRRTWRWWTRALGGALRATHGRRSL
jgi:hypothetical protein